MPTEKLGSLMQTTVARAAIMMFASTCMFACMAVTIRLATQELHAFEVAFFRNLFGFMFTLPILMTHGVRILRTDRIHLYIGRCLIGIVGMLAGFWAIAHLPLAQAVTISYSTPLFITIMAVLFLGEIVKIRRWIAVALGFAGVLIIMQPAGNQFDANTLAALLAAVMSAIVTVSIKILSRTERPDAIVVWTTLIWIPMSLVPALFVWTMPTGWTWLWIIAAGGLGTGGHWFWTRALKMADASMLTSVSFLQVPIVAVFGMLLFDEALTTWLVVGAIVIFLSNLYIAHREAVLARESERRAGEAN